MKTIFATLLFLISIACLGQKKLQPTDYDALINFKITDDKGVPEQNVVVKVENEIDKSVKIDTTDIEGNVFMLLKKGSKHDIVVLKLTYKFNFDDYEVPKHDGKLTIEENLQISVIPYKAKYELKIHFAPNKADLYPDAKLEIDKLADKMTNDPNMKIEIAGHTDNVGDEMLNMQVSQRRANAIKMYLIQKGISTKRLTAKGYGETTPVADNTTEEGRTRNRRIEIRTL